jgi:predicted nucleic acid-binding protein
MLFIYWLENNPQFAKRVGAIRTRMEERGDQLITGAFTIGEILAGPYRIGAVKVADETERLVRNVVSEVVPFSIEAADHYARIRGTLGFAPSAAIHLACAAQAGTDLFVTNDKKLVGQIVPGIHFIASLDTQLL